MVSIISALIADSESLQKFERNTQLHIELDWVWSGPVVNFYNVKLEHFLVEQGKDRIE